MLQFATQNYTETLRWNDDPEEEKNEKAGELMLGGNWQIACKDAESIRESIWKLEEFLLTLPQVELPITHNFAGGIYAREMRAPAGACITGKIHKFEHINILSKGSITVVTEHGLQYMQAPCTIISKPGTKRAGYAHEEVVWTSIHATKATTVEEAEAELFTNDYGEYLTFFESLKLEKKQ